MTKTLNNADMDSQQTIARLQRELAESTAERDDLVQRQTATADLLKVISRSTFDLDTVLDALADTAAKLCRANIGALTLRDGQVLVMRGVSNMPPDKANFLRRARIPIDRDSYMGRAILDGTIANVADFLTDTNSSVRIYQQTLGFRAILLVPLIREAHRIGLFGLMRDEVGAFSARQVEIVQSFADQAVVAIENTRLFNELQGRTNELSEALAY